jgi:hypothetical protein
VSEIPKLEEEVRRTNQIITTRRWPSGMRVTSEELRILQLNRDAAAIRLANLRERLER